MVLRLPEELNLIFIFYLKVLVRSFFQSESSLHTRIINDFAETRILLYLKEMEKPFLLLEYNLNHTVHSYFYLEDFSKGVLLCRGRVLNKFIIYS